MHPNITPIKLLNFAYCSILVLVMTVSALWITWWPLVQINFGYSAAYTLLSIDQTIERYGPLNRYRSHFGQTSRTEHERLFNDIVMAIKNNGKGLSDIVYHDNTGNPIAFLLREPEITHLIDVSTLVTAWQKWGGISLLFSIMLILSHSRLFSSTLTPLKLVRITFLWLALLISSTILIGPTKIFYLLHEHWFPVENQWFFYYQDSLMTTLMKAPDLFGWIASVWLCLSALTLGLVCWTWHYAVVSKKIFK